MIKKHKIILGFFFAIVLGLFSFGFSFLKSEPASLYDKDRTQITIVKTAHIILNKKQQQSDIQTYKFYIRVLSRP